MTNKIIVKKYGGSSVADIEKIKFIAKQIKNEIQNNSDYKFVIIISAMQGETDKLINYTKQMSDLITPENLTEYDSIISTGEQVSSGLLALELQALNLKAKSLLGWQIPILTDNNFSNAKIKYIDAENLNNHLTSNDVLIIAGFQGLNLKSDRITTLGRGGSDTTAVAIASVLNAERCDICKDVDGIFTSDPNKVIEAQKLDFMNFNDLIEITVNGAKMLHSRAAIMVNRYKVNLHIKSTFHDKIGTFIQEHDTEKDNKFLIKNIINSSKFSLVHIKNLENTNQNLHKFFKIIQESRFTIDDFSQNIIDNKLNLSFIAMNDEIIRINNIFNNIYENFEIISNIEKISFIGTGMLFNYTILERIFNILNTHNCDILYTSTNELKISIVIKTNILNAILNNLHREFIKL